MCTRTISVTFELTELKDKNMGACRVMVRLLVPVLIIGTTYSKKGGGEGGITL